LDRTQQLSVEALGRRGLNRSRSDCGYHSHLREGRTRERSLRGERGCERCALGVRGGEGEAELAWAGSEAANGLGVEGPRQGCACLRRSEGALEENKSRARRASALARFARYFVCFFGPLSATYITGPTLLFSRKDSPLPSDRHIRDHPNGLIKAQVPPKTSFLRWAEFRNFSSSVEPLRLD